MTFTQDELINAIRAARKDEGDTPNSITTRELAAALGVVDGQARELIRDAVRAGKLEPALVSRYVELGGYRRRLNGYVLAEDN